MQNEGEQDSVIITPAAPDCIGGRYAVSEVLGRGGMAVVYGATDRVTGRDVAVKQLTPQINTASAREAAVLFEREFHTLVQLSHPRVIETYDYGVDANGPYYTMERLFGGDLQQRSPLDWHQTCVICHDVCSSLALIHSRRLVHRDVSPRNIRCTPDGRAKLIDFGAMVPMGPSPNIVGTPFFVAPEVVHGSMLDGRTDIFSLGATLYYALTGRPAYMGRTFAQLLEAWKTKPIPPSRYVPDIPESLESLVLAMVSVDPSLRPQAAFDIMQRLATVARIDSSEPASVSQAYLITPTLVGRDGPIELVRARLIEALPRHGSSILIEGTAGAGRSRMLDACVLEAKLLGATVIRANAIGGSDKDKDFFVAHALVEQLAAELPEDALTHGGSELLDVLFDKAEQVPNVDRQPLPRYRLRRVAESPRLRLQSLRSLTDYFLRASERRAVVIAVDDAHRIDEPSAALLAALASRASESRLLLLSTAEQRVATSPALEVMTAHSTRVTLTVLDRDETQQLFASVFGDVPNLPIVSDGINALSAGVPRACMALAQHLVDTGKVRYEAGAWTLPAQLDPGDLPNSVEDAMAERLAALSPFARFLAEAQALASHEAFTREDFAIVGEEASAATLDAAISELVFRDLLVSDGRYFRFAHRGWAPLLAARLTEARMIQGEATLVRLYDGRPGVSVVRHLLACGRAEEAIDRLVAAIAAVKHRDELQSMSHLSAAAVATVIERALTEAEALERRPRDINDLRRALVAFAIGTDEAHYWRAAPSWLDQLRKDTGLDRWSEIEGGGDHATRSYRMLQLAYERYSATPEAERVYRPDEAIPLLIEYALASISIGGRLLHTALLESLPPVLEPFAPLAPAIEAIWQNSIATCESLCFAHAERALERWSGLYERLGKMTIEELPARDAIRRAIASGIGSVSARMGLASATDWVELSEEDPLHQIHALYLRRAMSLQQGDWERAEQHRREAEMLSVQAMVNQMFASSLVSELDAHALAGDLKGLRQVLDRMSPLASRSEGWRAYVCLAQAHFERARGNLASTREAAERCLAIASPTGTFPNLTAWIFAAGVLVEIASELGSAEEARAAGQRVLAICNAKGIGIVSAPVVRALSLAEARLGAYAAAEDRLDELAARQRELGVAGLQIGATFEARTRVAIWKRDAVAIVRFAALTGDAYRHGQGSPLSARYERLQDDARLATDSPLPTLSQIEAATVTVSETLRGAADGKERAARALALLCERHGAVSGRLYAVSDGGLTHLAAIGNEPLPHGLTDYLSDCLARELGADEMATADISETALHSPRSSSFIDSNGVAHRAMLLVATANDHPRYVAIAALVCGDTEAWDSSLRAAIAMHLLSAGDAAGVSPDPCLTR